MADPKLLVGGERQPVERDTNPIYCNVFSSFVSPNPGGVPQSQVLSRSLVPGPFWGRYPSPGWGGGTFPRPGLGYTAGGVPRAGFRRRTFLFTKFSEKPCEIKEKCEWAPKRM